MFEEQDEFKQIEDEAILWRYHDLPRYLDLLLKQQLFFCRADRFEDPFEGKYPLHRIEELVKERVKQMAGDKKDFDKAQAAVETLVEETVQKRPFVTINSWHHNTDENYAMWKIYAKGVAGIAIQTTYARLKKCFASTDKPVFIGKVAYYDEQYGSDLSAHSLQPFLCKRKMYQYENEVRCCYIISAEDETAGWQAQDNKDGIFINVDIDTLIERIYISPYSPKWIEDIVAGINERFNIKKEIVHSGIFDPADY